MRNTKLKMKRQLPADTSEIVSFLDNHLRIGQISDFSCNGLQVQGAPQLTRIGLAVDGCMESFKKAVELKCQLLFVHHGIIWDGIRSIRGTVYNQIRYLFEHNLNLYAAHLPLDMHSESGNNVQLARILGLKNLQPFGFYKGNYIGYEGHLTNGLELDHLVATLCNKLDTECTVLPFGNKLIKRVALVSGGGTNELTEAISKNIDCYITGEHSHQNYHAALEAGINVIYAGHYHTEKLGVQATGTLLTQQFGIETVFIDIPTAI